MEKFELVKYEPTEIVKIAVRDLSAPVQTAVELSKLAIVEKQIFVNLLFDAETDKESGKTILHPDTLAWARELRMLLKDIHDLTKGVQEKAMLKQIDIVGDLYKKLMKDKEPHEIVQLIKEINENVAKNKSQIN